MEDTTQVKSFTTSYWLGKKEWKTKALLIHDHIYDDQLPIEEYQAELIGDGEPIGKTLQYCIRNEWDEYSTWLSTRHLK